MLCTLAASHAQYAVAVPDTHSAQPPLGCTGAVNNHSIYAAAPTLVSSVPNGKRYSAGNASSSDTFYVVQLYGSHYEMGYAHGQLFASEIQAGLASFTTWVEAQVKPLLVLLVVACNGDTECRLNVQAEQAVPWLPAWLVDIIVELGMCCASMIRWDTSSRASAPPGGLVTPDTRLP